MRFQALSKSSLAASRPFMCHPRSSSEQVLARDLSTFAPPRGKAHDRGASTNFLKEPTAFPVPHNSQAGTYNRDKVTLSPFVKENNHGGSSGQAFTYTSPPALVLLCPAVKLRPQRMPSPQRLLPACALPAPCSRGHSMCPMPAKCPRHPHTLAKARHL